MHNDKQDNWYIKYHSNFSGNIDKQSYINTFNSHIFPAISRVSLFNPAYHGAYKIHEYGKGLSNAFILIPLKAPPEAEVIVVCGLPQNSYLLGDIYGRIVSSFYQASQRLTLQAELVEAAIVDDLKRDFGFVSASLYERRFQLFCQNLRRMIVHFEPIFDLEHLTICGWEALARDPESLKAPVDLFDAVELWGPQFSIELDQHFLKVATKSYQEARKQLKQNRINEILPLSVNVYPESLMRTAYFEAVRRVFEDKLIPKTKLILEISEKTELPHFESSADFKSPSISFQSRLHQFVTQLGARFAIDDFGVGYASVSRLAGLINPSYVKIDRNILLHQPCDVIIRFVRELVEANNLNPPNVIVEGVDETIPITLYDLKKLGVQYIQGHIIGQATANIYRLSQEKYEFLEKRINGDLS
ncbi:MAG: EAL domain-containing protein [Calothrix sp. SM1_7_51]|nr:EAL domain-containing protein [Calothrix sp. SM1_7_51]